MSDQERAEAAARVLADAITCLAKDLTGQGESEILATLRVTAEPDFISYIWDWYWRPAGATRSSAGMAAQPRPPRQVTPGLHAPGPRITI